MTTMPLNPPPHRLEAKNALDVHVCTSGRPSRSYHEVAILEAQQESHSFDE